MSTVLKQGPVLLHMGVGFEKAECMAVLTDRSLRVHNRADDTLKEVALNDVQRQCVLLQDDQSPLPINPTCPLHMGFEKAAHPNNTHAVPALVLDRLVLLPDYARRSRHTELYPFHVKSCGDLGASDEELAADGLYFDDGILLAVESAEELWAWAFAIRFRGAPPVDALHPQLPRLSASTTQSIDDHFTDPKRLQESVLHVMAHIAPRVGLAGT